MRVFVIDPSIRALGWCLGQVDKKAESGVVLESGHLQQSTSAVRLRSRRGGGLVNGGDYEDDNWVDMMDRMLRDTWWVFENRGYSDIVLIEQPRVFNAGVGAAASASGAVLKLNSFVFSARQMFREVDVPVLLVPVQQWKGNSPKSITQKRIARAWGWKGKSSDEADAVGIYDWYVRKVLCYEATKIGRGHR